MNVHFDKSPHGAAGVDKRPPMSYPYIVMPDAKLSPNATLFPRTIRRGHPYGFDILDSVALPSDTVSPALRRLEQHLKSKCETEEVAFADQRLAGKSSERARAKNH